MSLAFLPRRSVLSRLICCVQEGLGRRRLLAVVASTSGNDGELSAGTVEQGSVLSSRGPLTFQEVGALVASLKACAEKKDLYKGSRVHADILQKGLLEKHICLGNALINLYAKCGAVAKAKEVFNELQVRNIVSWNALIAGYAQNGHGKEALNCFERLQQEGLSADAVTIVCVLKACGSIRASDKGKEIHLEILRDGLLGKNILVGTALVDMYAKCGEVKVAQEAFDKLEDRDVVSWNALIAGFVQHGHGEEALNCFERMQHEGVSPNAVTFACILKACCSIGAFDKGLNVHAKIHREGLLENSTLVGNALIDMYAKSGELEKAQEVFDDLRVRNVVSWNALIAGYAQHGHAEALNCFEQMKCDGTSPDAVTFVCTLKACGKTGAIDKGTKIHAEIVREELLEKDNLVGNALVDMYAKCGALRKAEDVFNKLPVQDVVSWNALIAGYVQHGHGEDALKCFKQMQQKGVFANVVTFLCILKACSSIGSADMGKEIHTEISREGLLEKDVAIGNAVVDMYAKCGAHEKAQEVFDKLRVRDVVSWTTLISGYAQLGMDGVVVDSFDKMLEEGLEPNLVTFTTVLNACSHSGLLERAQMYFRTMTVGYGIIPTKEHYSCIVDLFGRTGDLDKMVAMSKKMPSFDHLPIWTAVLSACRRGGDVKLGRLAFDYAVHLHDKDAAAYVCMSNIYAAAAMQEDANKIEAIRVKNKAWKHRGEWLV